MKIFVNIIFVLSFILNSCYTVIDNTKEVNDKIISNKVVFDDSIIEGTVEYIKYPANTMETHYTSGFILKDYKWLINPPKYKANKIYIKGNIDSSFISKRVQIKGVYKIPLKIPSSAPDYTSIINIISEEIFIID